MTVFRTATFWFLLLPSAVAFAFPGVVFGEEFAFERWAPVILPLQAFVTVAVPYVLSQRLLAARAKQRPGFPVIQDIHGSGEIAKAATVQTVFAAQQGESLKAAKVDRSADLHIEHSDKHGVIVARDYPDFRRRKSMKVLAIVCPLLCSVPLILWLTYLHGLVNWFVVLTSALFIIIIVSRIIRQFNINTRSYVLRANHTGLTIEMTTWRRRTTRHFVRSEINDIVLDCSGGRDPHHSLFRTWLVIKVALNGEIHCLHDVGGDQLARAANALRAAMRMPARSWP